MFMMKIIFKGLLIGRGLMVVSMLSEEEVLESRIMAVLWCEERGLYRYESMECKYQTIVPVFHSSSASSLLPDF
jgi:hypothetical protein